MIFLRDILHSLAIHPYLKSRVVLKGGAALNLFYYALPRLSVDIDLNYIGALEKETMEAERGNFERAFMDIADYHGFAWHSSPRQYAGGKYQLTYPSVLGHRGSLQLDLNFLHRQPLLPIQWKEAYALDFLPSVERVPVLDIHEIAAGKLIALLSRHKSRDLFDAALLSQQPLEEDKLRYCFVTYAALYRKRPDTLKAEHIHFESRELKNQLIPMLNKTQLKTLSERE